MTDTTKKEIMELASKIAQLSEQLECVVRSRSYEIPDRIIFDSGRLRSITFDISQSIIAEALR